MKIEATFTLGQSTYTTQLEVDRRLMNQDAIRMAIALLISQRIELLNVSAVDEVPLPTHRPTVRWPETATAR